MMSEPRIYVADLAAYNAGHLHGVWINAGDDLDDIKDQIGEMLKKSPVKDAEEYAIHDYEGFGGYEISEYEGIETAHKIAYFIEDHPELGGELLAHFCGDIEEANKAIEEHYCGEYSSLADYAQNLTGDTTDIPKHLEFYIDYECMGRDMEMSGDIFTIETSFDKVHIFWNR